MWQCRSSKRTPHRKNPSAFLPRVCFMLQQVSDSLFRYRFANCASTRLQPAATTLPQRHRFCVLWRPYHPYYNSCKKHDIQHPVRFSCSLCAIIASWMNIMVKTSTRWEYDTSLHCRVIQILLRTCLQFITSSRHAYTSLPFTLVSTRGH